MELRKGHLVARLARDAGDVARAQTLRHIAFRAARGLAPAGGQDADRFDAACQHVLVEEAGQGGLMACFRVLRLSPAHLYKSYSAQFYDLTPLQQFQSDSLELGRFCLTPGLRDPDVLRLAWAAITRMVDDHGIGLMFGCSSFDGADPVRHAAAFAHLAAHHLGPESLRPKASTGQDLPLCGFTASTGPATLPPLLRSYLGMGGWVGADAVIDRDLDTAHVFTAIEVAKIPAARARALRALAS